MTNWHGYFAIEDLNLNVDQRAVLIDALKALGPAQDAQPARLCHWRLSLDRSKAIFEAAFNEDNLTIEAFKLRLASIFGVNAATIDHSLQSVTISDRSTPVVTFSRMGIDYLRVALFGGLGATWDQSRIEALSYLALNRTEWEENG